MLKREKRRIHRLTTEGLNAEFLSAKWVNAEFLYVKRDWMLNSWMLNGTECQMGLIAKGTECRSGTDSHNPIHQSGIWHSGIPHSVPFGILHSQTWHSWTRHSVAVGIQDLALRIRQHWVDESEEALKGLKIDKKKQVTTWFLRGPVPLRNCSSAVLYHAGTVPVLSCTMQELFLRCPVPRRNIWQFENRIPALSRIAQKIGPALSRTAQESLKKVSNYWVTNQKLKS
jgi:hypothetical protein